MPGGHKPGSSLRCDECRRRRKKCDLQQPQCLRCRQSGITCSGPKTKAAVFVNRHTEAFASQTQREALSGAYRDRTVATSSDRSGQFYKVTSDHVEQLRSRVERLNTLSSLGINESLLSTHRALVLPTYAALLEEFKAERQVFSGDRIKSGEPKHYSSIATCIRSLTMLGSLDIAILDRCIVPLLALYYGRLHGDAGLVDFARSRYTTALNEVSHRLGRAIADSGTAGTQWYPVLIAASMALQVFEHLNDVAMFGEGHLAHINGALQLLHASGPLMLQRSNEIRNAFGGLRSVAVLVAIEDRKPTFLAETEWMTAPFKGHTKSARDHLTDLALGIPSILHSADLVLAKLGSNAVIHPRLIDLGLHLVNEIADLQRRFEQWLYQLKTSASGPLYWSRTHPGPGIPLEDEGDDECRPKYTSRFHQLQFPSGPIAGLLAHYWSFQLQLLMTAIDLQRSLHHHTSVTSSAPREPNSLLAAQTMSGGVFADRIMAEKTAQLIMETQPYLSSCFEGLLCLQSPLQILAKYFKQYSSGELLTTSL